jgi:hypothetical protein
MNPTATATEKFARSMLGADPGLEHEAHELHGGASTPSSAQRRLVRSPTPKMRSNTIRP